MKKSFWFQHYTIVVIPENGGKYHKAIYLYLYIEGRIVASRIETSTGCEAAYHGCPAYNVNARRESLHHMENFSPTDLKTILHSKRANIYYLEKCRVMQKDGRVLYLTEAKNINQYWNIPIANTTCILLGTGTSITQAAVRLLASSGVLIGFSGGGATPLFAGSEIEWLTPQSEYRPTEYMQGWMSFWFDEQKRFAAAKRFQLSRIEFLKHVWSKDRELRGAGFTIDDAEISQALITFGDNITQVSRVSDLLQIEAQFSRSLYRIAASRTQYGKFVRQREACDTANVFLNHGNYLAYGLGATTLWVLGINHGFALMHGKTRRGALVFDIADLIKDALVLPMAFICAQQQTTEQGFRRQCLQMFTDNQALDFMFDQVKSVALKQDWEKNPQ